MNPRPLTAVIRQVSPGGIASLEFFPLSTKRDVTLGRDPDCEIVLDSRIHKGVSRRHASIYSGSDESDSWYIYDLNSSNGTYINGIRIQKHEGLHEGDRISLGKRGPQFVFEYLDCPSVPDNVDGLPADDDSEILYSAADIALSGKFEQIQDSSAASLHANDVTLSQLFPIISTGRDLTRKAYLVPGIITVVSVVSLFVLVDYPETFNKLFAGYLAAAAYYFVYQLCGKHKPWWLLLGSGLMTAIVLSSPLLNGFIKVFREILPGNIPADPSNDSFPSLLVKMFFGAGLMEELIKALPILCAWLVGRYGKSARHRNLIGVNEPLDGILIGTASAIGFTLIETLRVYAPGATTQLVELQIIIPRLLGSVAGHMAYSGYLGYFIGLSALKPKKQWQIIAVGYLSASALHALWNTTGYINPIVLAFTGAVSYACLTAAILKARALSPTRSQNFATRFTRIR